jgi:hypothetical protein
MMQCQCYSQGSKSTAIEESKIRQRVRELDYRTAKPLTSSAESGNSTIQRSRDGIQALQPALECEAKTILPTMLTMAVRGRAMGQFM